MILKRRLALRILRSINRFRRRVRRFGQRFCASHPYCLFCNVRHRSYQRWLCIRDWLAKEVKRGAENKGITNLHRLILVLTAFWLFVEAVYLIDVNFPLPGFDHLFQSLRQRHDWLDFWMKHVRPVLVVASIAWLRELSHEWFQLRPDQVRATLLTKLWFGFFLVLLTVVLIVKHDWNAFKMTPSARDLTLFLGWVWAAKRVSRTFKKPVANRTVPQTKKTQSAVKAVITFLLRSRTQ